MSEIQVHTPTVDNLKEYLNYQYPATKGNIKLDKLLDKIKVIEMNEPFYKEFNDSFEEALGPHPTISNGQWITRCKELREENEKLKQKLSEKQHNV